MTADPSHDVTADELRSRAAVLRALADSIDAGPGRWLGELARRRGPSASNSEALRCSVLSTNLMQLHRAADDLRCQAYELDARANTVERAGAASRETEIDPARRCLDAIGALECSDPAAAGALRVARLVALNVGTLAS